MAMDAVDQALYTPWGLRLNAPSYTRPDDGIGFITRVYCGVKENGSIFSHSNPWAWCAEARLGRGARAMKFYRRSALRRRTTKSKCARASRIPIASLSWGRITPPSAGRGIHS